MRVRLRDAMTDQQFASMYNHNYNHTQWEEHKRRIAWTLDVAHQWLKDETIGVAIDLACGDGVILSGIKAEIKLYGDFVATPFTHYVGKIEETITRVGADAADLFVCTETIEHIDDPDSLIRQIAGVSQYLLLSTPLGETDPYKNWEHYWGWDLDGIRKLLEDNGFTPLNYEVLVDEFYTYQLWLAGRTELEEK
jgi:hypothetical protein